MQELIGCQEGLCRQHLQQHPKRFEGVEWLFCWITEYPQSQGPWPWAQQIFSAEYDLIPSEVKLFFPVAKKTSKLSNHFALRGASNLLGQPHRTRGPRSALELLGSVTLSILNRIQMRLGCMPSIKRTLTWSRKCWRAASVSSSNRS